MQLNERRVGTMRRTLNNSGKLGRMVLDSVPGLYGTSPALRRALKAVVYDL